MVRGQICRIFTGYFLDSRKKFSENLQCLYVQDHGNVQKSCKFEFSEYLGDIYRIISVKVLLWKFFKVSSVISLGFWFKR